MVPSSSSSWPVARPASRTEPVLTFPRSCPSLRTAPGEPVRPTISDGHPEHDAPRPVVTRAVPPTRSPCCAGPRPVGQRLGPRPASRPPTARWPLKPVHLARARPHGRSRAPGRRPGAGCSGHGPHAREYSAYQIATGRTPARYATLQAGAPLRRVGGPPACDRQAAKTARTGGVPRPRWVCRLGSSLRSRRSLTPVSVSGAAGGVRRPL